jgi:hypothetical protein
MLKFPHFLDNRLIDGGKVVSLTRRPPFTPSPLPKEDSWLLISVRGWVHTRVIVRLEGVGKLKKSTSSGLETRDLPNCSIVLQPTTLPRAPTFRDTTKYVQSLLFSHLEEIQQLLAGELKCQENPAGWPRKHVPSARNVTASGNWREQYEDSFDSGFPQVYYLFHTGHLKK